jgi:hypothetical protein
MTNDDLTDFFAGLAMQAWITELGKPNFEKTIAKRAYEQADAMMEERKRRDFEERTSC